jgi:hypothetical protein
MMIAATTILNTIDKPGADGTSVVWTYTTATPREEKRQRARSAVEKALRENPQLSNDRLIDILEGHELSFKKSGMVAMFATVRESLGLPKQKPGPKAIQIEMTESAVNVQLGNLEEIYEDCCGYVESYR